MKRYYTTLLLLLMTWNFLQAQKKTQFRDFILDHDQLWALTIKGRLAVYDLKHIEAPPVAIPYDDSIVVLTKDEQSAIVVCDSSGYIRKYDREHGSWQEMDSYKEKLYSIVFDRMDHYYLVTPKGIIDGVTRKVYFPERYTNPVAWYKFGWEWHAPVCCMDPNDDLWLGFRYGEWGGDIFIFNTRTKKFLAPRLKKLTMSLNPVQSICSGAGKIYVTTGMNHLGMTEGRIAVFDRLKATVIFNGDPDTARYPHRNDWTLEGEFIGPAAFNDVNHCLYFYSQHGIFKGDVSGDLSNLDKWEKVASPKLLWSSGQPDAVGAPMNVLKMAFSDDMRLIFLSQLNGIGVVNGDSIVFLP